jgi:DNA-directed RNA polymerase specialized sigma24 family protein
MIEPYKLIDGFCYPLWAEDILPYNQACGYISKKGRRENRHAILNTVLERLDRARQKPGRKINKSYVFVALRNAVTDCWRKESKQPASNEFTENSDAAESQTCDDPIKYLKNHQDLLNSILIEMGRLDVRSRVLVKLKCHESYRFTFKELADIVGYSESTARMEYNKYIQIIRGICKDKETALIEN